MEIPPGPVLKKMGEGGWAEAAEARASRARVLMAGWVVDVYEGIAVAGFANGRGLQNAETVDGAKNGTDRSVCLHNGIAVAGKSRELWTGRKPGQTALSARRQRPVCFRECLWRLGTEWSVPVFAMLSGFAWFVVLWDRDLRACWMGAG